MPVTARSLRRNRTQAASSTRTAASILAGIVGLAGAAWGVAYTFEPYRFNAAKSGQWQEEQPAPTPVDPILISLPTVGEPAEDLAAGSPSAWRSSSNLLSIADSLNTTSTPTSGGIDGGSDGGNGGGGNWVIPGPGRSIDVPGLDGGDGGDDGGLSRPGYLVEPGRDGLVADCVRDAVDAGEESTETVLAPKPLVDAVVEPECATEEEAPAEEAAADPAEPGAGGDASSTVA